MTNPIDDRRAAAEGPRVGDDERTAAGEDL